MRARVGLELYTAGSGFCGLGVWTAGLAPKPGPCRLEVYVVKDQGPTQPYILSLKAY
jgi:hypothetical protein